MWRTTFPYLREALRSHKTDVLVVVAGGFISGAVVTAKSLIESRIISRVGDALREGSPESILDVPLGRQASSDADWVTRLTDWAMSSVTITSAVPVYFLIGIIAAVFSVATVAARGRVQRTLLSGLLRSALASAMRSTSDLPRTSEVGGLAGAVQVGAVSVAAGYGYLIEAVQNVFVLGFALAALLSVGPSFAGLCLVVALVLASVSWWQARRLEATRKSYDTLRRQLVAGADDVLVNRDVLVAHERGETYVERLRKSADDLGSADLEIAIRQRRFGAASGFIQDAGIILSLVIAVVAVLSGSPAERVGDAYFVVSLFSRLMSPIRGLLSGYDDIRASASTSDTLVGLLENPPASRPVASEQNAAEPGVAARLTDVSFFYGDQRILQGCDLMVPRGGTTLIVGRSGSGKSTIARLLLGFLRARSGQVTVLGRPVGAWDHTELLAQMSYLAQTGHVLRGPVRENLFARPDTTDVELAKALVSARLVQNPSDAVLLLDKEAAELSEGQKQRLALARILVDTSPFVVLDEPLAGIDAFTFRDVMPHLDQWLANPSRTVVLVSHKLAFVSAATHVVVLGDDGRVAEQGPPKDLLSNESGVFRSLYTAAAKELSAAG